MRRGAGALVIASALWLPALHLFFTPASNSEPIPLRADRLAAYQLELLGDSSARAREASRMRQTNAEWDFMGRTFFVLALGNMALRDRGRAAQYLEVIDGIIDETLRLEQEDGLYFFLMPYAKRRPFVLSPARSQFLDGELALMLGLRRLVAPKAEYRPLLAQRVELMVERMAQSPVLSAESYPDECWTFCNTVALAAIRLADHLDGTDHGPLLRAWVERARSELLDPATGLLVSTYTLHGQTIYGPEGSSIWLSAHMLQLVDPGFAADQYQRAKHELMRNVLGFGYAREWPSSSRGAADVDSGPVIPLLDVSAGSSGLALVAASAFGDDATDRALLATLDFAAFPIERDGKLHYGASNQVGDAVLLYSLVLGPAWRMVLGEARP